VPNCGFWLSTREYNGESYIRVQHYYGINAPKKAKQFTMPTTSLNIPSGAYFPPEYEKYLSTVPNDFIPLPMDDLDYLCLQAELIKALRREDGAPSAAGGGGLLAGESIARQLFLLEDAPADAEALVASAAGGSAEPTSLASVVRSTQQAINAEALAYLARIRDEQEARSRAVAEGTTPGLRKTKVLGGSGASKKKADTKSTKGSASSAAGGVASSTGRPALDVSREVEALIEKRRVKFRTLAGLLAKVYKAGAASGVTPSVSAAGGSHRTIHDDMGLFTIARVHGTGDSTLPGALARSILDRAILGLQASLERNAAGGAAPE
jgi:hypothetical protein